MNIIARAAVYIYDGSPIAPIFPAKAQKPSDDAGEYLSAIAEKLMTSDTSRTTYVAEGSAQEELLRRFILAPFGEAADVLMHSIDETMQDYAHKLERARMAKQLESGKKRRRKPEPPAEAET